MKKLFRSTSDRYLAGLCGGIGEVFGVDPNIVRLAAIFLAIVTGMIPLVVTYLVAWVIVPEGAQAG